MAMKLNKKGLLDPLFRKISRMTRQEQTQAVFAVVVIVVFLFFPLVSIQPLDGEARSLGLLSGQFFKTAVLLLLALALLVGWNTSVHCKDFVHSTFGFKGNDHLLNFILLWVLLTGLLALGEGARSFAFVTSTVKTTFAHSFLVLLMFVGLAYSLVMMLQEAKVLKGTRLMSVKKSRSSRVDEDTQEVQSLFEEE